MPGSARRYRLEHGCGPELPGEDDAPGLLAGAPVPGADESPGDVDDVAVPDAGADADDVAPGAAAVVELDSPAHPAMAPVRASATPASKTRPPRADEVMKSLLSSHARTPR
jgi:hypothetical protein